jgi:hypothetical protein
MNLPNEKQPNLTLKDRDRPHGRLKTALRRFAFPLCLGLLAAFLAIEIGVLVLKHFGPIKDSIFRYD